MLKVDMKKYKVSGSLAHQAKPKKRIDFSRTIEAEDAVHALGIYRRKLRGVKKSRVVGIVEVHDG